jgi:hypothetical protein
MESKIFRVELSAPKLASLTTALAHVTSCVLCPLDVDGRAELERLRLELAGVYLEAHPAAQGPPPAPPSRVGTMLALAHLADELAAPAGPPWPDIQ